MLLISIAFLIGIMVLQTMTVLPTIGMAASLSIFSMAFIIPKKLRPFTRYPAIAILGFCWCILFVHWQTQWTLPSSLEGKSISISGYIATIPEVTPQQTKFTFQLKSINGKSIYPNQLIHLSWPYSMEDVKVGDEWMFTAKLKKIHGLLNPGGSDYEARALEEGIRATGYIYKNQARLISSHLYHFPLQRFREWIYSMIASVLPASHTSHWIYALSIGIRQHIPAEQWDVLRKTGTNHLMAIAGLHIGIMSSIAYFIGNFLWRRSSKLCLRLPAQSFAGFSAFLVALFYSALAGFSLPTQRACLMVFAFFALTLFKRMTSIGYTWSVALLLILIVNPLAVLTDSFWLSFGSVALIIYGVSARLAPKGIWWKLGRIQWVLTIGLIPLNIGLFHECSWISFVANSIAIPWVSFLTLPLIILGCVCFIFSSALAGFLLIVADKSLGYLWNILTYLSHVSFASSYHVVPSIAYIIIACIGVMILLIPKGLPGRWFGLIGLLPMMFYAPDKPKQGDAWVTLLDVGQGLSTVIQTKNHLLVFDAGAKWNDNSDMGTNVVVPFLRSMDTRAIDMLVVSHQDNDHSGGAKSILSAFPTRDIKTSQPSLFSGLPVSLCLKNQAWDWDGVHFKFLYPSMNELGMDNDSSCVLKVSTSSKSILIPGDIEKIAEQNLLETESDLAADILIAPHHGSKTSAMTEFVEAVNPTAVLFAVGYRNRYHLPNESVVKKYQHQGAYLYNSVTSGAIQIDLSNLIIVSYRDINKHYWSVS